MTDTMLKTSRAIVEVREILKYASKDVLDKLPPKFAEELERMQDNNYKFEYDMNKSFEEQEFMPETKELLAAIYLMYCCNMDKKAEILKTCTENEQKQNEYIFQNIINKEDMSINDNNINVESNENSENNESNENEEETKIKDAGSDNEKNSANDENNVNSNVNKEAEIKGNASITIVKKENVLNKIINRIKKIFGNKKV